MFNYIKLNVDKRALIIAALLAQRQREEITMHQPNFAYTNQEEYLKCMETIKEINETIALFYK